MLSALFLVPVNSLSLFFLILSSNPRTDESTLSSMLVSPLPSSFLDTYSLCHLSDIKSCASSSAFLSSGPFIEILPLSISRMVASILEVGQLRCLTLWWDSSCKIWFREVFSFVWDTLKNFFFNLHLFDGVRFLFSQVLVIFLFFERSDSFLTWQFYSFCYLSFSASPYEHDTFFYTEFHSSILTLYSYCLYQSPLLLHFWKQLDVVHVH